MQQRDTHLNYARVVASRRRRRTRSGERAASTVRGTERARPHSSAAWLVTLFPSFALPVSSRRLFPPLLLFSRSPARSVRPTAVRALTCHWPCPLASVSRLPTRPFIRGSFSLSFFSPSTTLLLLFLRLHCLCLYSPSSSDSRVYSRALAAFFCRPGTRVLSSSSSGCALHSRSSVNKIQRQCLNTSLRNIWNYIAHHVKRAVF